MYSQYDIDIFSILVLAVVFFNNIKNAGGARMKLWILRALMICGASIMLIDMLTLIISGQPGIFIRALFEILQCYFFALCSLFCFLWLQFCAIRPNGRQSKLFNVLSSLPLLVLIGFLLTNNITGYIFRITDGNIYQRGPFFIITTVCTYSYIIYSLLLIIRNRKSMAKREYYPYIVMPIFPIAAGIIQLTMNIDVLVVWPATVISILVVHLNTIGEKMNIDHLTGLYNRKYLDEFINDILQSGKAGQAKKFAAIMLDIDDFKSINDTYGHIEGDNAIKTAAFILGRSVRKGDFVSRYGGDEFLIILDRCSKNTPERVIRRINESLKRYNSEHDLPYRLEFSVGYRQFDKVQGLTSKDVFTIIDGLMYKNKKSKLFGTAKHNDEVSNTLNISD